MCMFIVSKALLISGATVIVRAGGAIWLNPFVTVLFDVCGGVTVECCVLYPCCMCVFAITERRDMGMHDLHSYTSNIDNIHFRFNRTVCGGVICPDQSK